MDTAFFRKKCMLKYMMYSKMNLQITLKISESVTLATAFFGTDHAMMYS